MKLSLGHCYRGWNRSDLTPDRLATWDRRNDRYEDGDLNTQLELAFALRRCHSQLVFQAIQAVLAVAGTSIARANPDDAKRYPYSYCRELCTQAGWVKL